MFTIFSLCVGEQLLLPSGEETMQSWFEYFLFVYIC